MHDADVEQASQSCAPTLRPHQAYQVKAMCQRWPSTAGRPKSTQQMVGEHGWDSLLEAGSDSTR